MTIILVALFVFVLLTAGAIGILLLTFIQGSRGRSGSVTRPPDVLVPSSTVPGLYFRFTDVILPVVVLVISVLSTIIFYGLIPTRVGYHFTPDGSVDRWVNRGLLTIAMLMPQFLLAFLSVGIALVMVKVGGRYVNEGKARLSAVRGVIVLMSNMVAFPQLVLCFAMLDIFSYNAFQVHLFPLYIFAILVMLVGGLFLGFFFLRAMREAKTG